jgi:putative transcriptional regulator
MVTARLKDDATVVEIRRDGSERPLAAQVDWAKIDAITEEGIAEQIAQDDAEAMRDAAAYARRVRREGGLSQVAFARRIGVPVDTVRNWERGKRAPQDPLGRGCGSSTARPKRRCMRWTGRSQARGFAWPKVLRYQPPHQGQPPLPARLTRARIPTVAWTSRKSG